MRIREILVSAKEMISDPAYWTIGVMARDANGDKTDCLGDEVECYCSLGAVYRLCWDPKEDQLRYAEWGKACLALASASEQLHSSSPSELNDNFGHVEVMKMFDLAIKECTE